MARVTLVWRPASRPPYETVGCHFFSGGPMYFNST
jgi:hypothetical protein